MKTLIPLISFLLVQWEFPLFAIDATDPSFREAVAQFQDHPTDATAEAVIKLTAKMESIPEIPEEARKRLIRGAALCNDAKSTDDYQGAVEEFSQAVKLAPWIPKARFSLALAYEGRGDLAKAMANVKLYQLFKLSDSEARVAQDKIYALEARMEKAAKRQDEEATKARDADRILRQALTGSWFSESGSLLFEIIASGDSYSLRRAGLETSKTVKFGWNIHNAFSYSFSGLEISGRNLRFRETTRFVTSYEKGTVTDETWTDKYDLTLSEDGKKLQGTCIYHEGDPSNSKIERMTAFRQ